MAGSGSVEMPEDAVERRYAMCEVKQRLHQASFREAVPEAYRGRCAISGLPTPQLLDACHIIADGDDEFGAPVIPNGLALSKVHHAVFDGCLIGIDPDHRLLLPKPAAPRLLLIPARDAITNPLPPDP